jgi:hypothetical protein
MRFTVTTKIIVSFGTIFFVGLLAMTLIYRGLGIVTTDLQKLAHLEEPLNASTYEMEINVKEIQVLARENIEAPRLHAEPR